MCDVKYIYAYMHVVRCWLEMKQNPTYKIPRFIVMLSQIRMEQLFLRFFSNKMNGFTLLNKLSTKHRSPKEGERGRGGMLKNLNHVVLLLLFAD